MVLARAPGPTAPPSPLGPSLREVVRAGVNVDAVSQMQVAVVVFIMLAFFLCRSLRHSEGKKSIAQRGLDEAAIVSDEVVRDLGVAAHAIAHPLRTIENLLGGSDGLEPLMICGPSGAGKGTLIGKLQKAFPDKFGFSVSHTTRQPRPGEQNGIDYHFTTVDMMKSMKEEGQFLEDADVHGHMYGTSRDAVGSVQKQRQICILKIDVQDARQVKEKMPDAHFLCIKPPSLEILKQRLTDRGTLSPEEITKRMNNAVGELECGKEPGFVAATIVNASLEQAETELIEQVRLWYPSLPEAVREEQELPPPTPPAHKRDLVQQGPSSPARSASPQRRFEGKKCTVLPDEPSSPEKALIQYENGEKEEVATGDMRAAPPGLGAILRRRSKDAGDKQDRECEVTDVMDGTFSVKWLGSQEDKEEVSAEDLMNWEDFFEVVKEKPDVEWF